MGTEGDFHGFVAMHSDSSNVNVLCQSEVETVSDVYDIPSWGTIVITADGALDFLKNGKRYVLDMKGEL